MSSRRTRLIQTHRFADGLLALANEYVRIWQFGRISLVWAAGKPVPPPIPTSQIIPTKVRPEAQDSGANS